MKKPYNDYIKILSEKFETRLRDISPDFNFDYGIEFEIALCEILRAFLPEKYGVCRGHVVDFEGNNVGDDIIIFDQQRFPTIRLHDREQFARKENIPIEAVCAYIEAKHNLDVATYKKGLDQIKKAKKFISKRAKVPTEQIDPYLEPLKRNVTYNKSYPSYRNPVYCALISAKSSLTQKEIEDIEANEIDSTFPELILFSKSDYLQIGYNESDGFQPTLFLCEDEKIAYAHINDKSGLCFGIFLSNLIASLDWQQLGRIPWVKMLDKYISSNERNNQA